MSFGLSRNTDRSHFVWPADSRMIQGHVKDGRRVPYAASSMAPAKVPVSDPCPSGLPEVFGSSSCYRHWVEFIRRHHPDEPVFLIFLAAPLSVSMVCTLLGI